MYKEYNIIIPNMYPGKVMACKVDSNAGPDIIILVQNMYTQLGGNIAWWVKFK